jgi:hypothetical protein
MVISESLQAGRAVGGLGHAASQFLKYASQPGPRVGLIIDDKDVLFHACFRFWGDGSDLRLGVKRTGSSIITAVPWPGVL